MKTKEIAIPRIVNRQEWLALRKTLLEKEKNLTRERDRLNAKRRRLPMVEVEKDYQFEGPNGIVNLLDLFEGRRQLIVHHFMYFDDSDTFCQGCSAEADQNYSTRFFEEMHKHDLSVVAIARASLSRIEEEKEKKSWNFPFYSSQGSHFHYDFQATLKNGKNSTYNYENAEGKEWLREYEGDLPGKSVFLKHGQDVFHTYSAYTRGLESVATHYNYLDLTPYGRQEEWENSPEGWPQKPAYQ